MATIKDVAKKAGVSISTASYALNNLPNVHPDTRARILKAAESLNYYPNGVARNLKTKRTGNIGVFVYGFSGPIFSDVLEGIRQKLQENNYNIIVSSGKSSSNLLKERQVDGAIVFDGELPDDILISYANHGLPLIVLDRELDGENIYSSTIDNEKLVYDFIKDMILKGYQSFGYLSGPLDAFNNNHRYDGFKKALEDSNIMTHHYMQSDFTIHGGYREGLNLVNQVSKPDFVFCANDESAIGFMQALKENGMKIPKDIALAGFDNIYLGDYTSPKLTTIGIDHNAWGKHVAQRLIDLIHNKANVEIKNPTGRVILRESC